MADQEDESRKRRRQREKEDEGSPGSQPNSRDVSSPVDAKIKEIDIIIDQLSNLYHMYVSGVERLPPIEKRKQLDQMMILLQNMSKPTQAIQFRYNTLNAKYISYRDRWDKLMKNFESGSKK